MYIAYVDEAGFSYRWQDEVDEQPFYVLAGVVIEGNSMFQIYDQVRSDISRLNISDIDHSKLGRGEEIKARDIDSGRQGWNRHPERDRVREAYLCCLPSCSTFLVAIDLKKHKKEYDEPEEPYKLAFRFFCERLQGFLEDKNDSGIVILDSNPKIESEQAELASKLAIDGSWGRRLSDQSTWRLELNRILEFHFADSKYCLGLQIADFVARHAYSWIKNEKDSSYPGWRYIKDSLYRRQEKFHGWGYKEFP